MESTNPRSTSSIARQLASLKLLSRLLGHEIHAQGTSKTITLSRDEVVEIQTAIDLFIEEASRRGGASSSSAGSGASSGAGAEGTQLVVARNN